MDKKSPLFMRLVSCGNGCVFASGVLFSGIIMSCNSLYSVIKGLWYEPRFEFESPR